MGNRCCIGRRNVIAKLGVGVVILGIDDLSGPAREVRVIDSSLCYEVGGGLGEILNRR